MDDDHGFANTVDGNLNQVEKGIQLASGEAMRKGNWESQFFHKQKYTTFYSRAKNYVALHH